ncbi:hypothetical protein F8A87_05115 [Betaproteobacteria bacterium SCN2]|jgi:hypothetical protein|nr:hypothetical protein F8A87_05115 [Betaproteobacteria bacterium SCN2]
MTDKVEVAIVDLLPRRELLFPAQPRQFRHDGSPLPDPGLNGRRVLGPLRQEACQGFITQRAASRHFNAEGQPPRHRQVQLLGIQLLAHRI